MREYETIYLLKPDLPQDQVKTLIGRLSEIVQKSGGHILHHMDWGKRKLAYRVQKFRHGQYVYFQFLDDGRSVAEIERILKYDDKTLRFLTVRVSDVDNVEEVIQKPPPPPTPPEEYVEEPRFESGPSRSGGPYRSSRSGPVVERISESREGPGGEPEESGDE